MYDTFKKSNQKSTPVSKKSLSLRVTLRGKIFKIWLMNRQYFGIEISDLFFLTPSRIASAALSALMDPKKPGTYEKNNKYNKID